MSIQQGAGCGFQFEFYCDRCRDAWRSDFEPYRTGQASSWLDKASSVFGGMLRTFDAAAQTLTQAGYNSAHSDAFKVAVERSDQHFHRCPKCLQHVCQTCWDVEKGLCLTCAPSLAVETQVAKATGQVKTAVEKANAIGEKQGAEVQVADEAQLVCPKCKAETHGAKFCPECGEKLIQHAKCACGANLPAGVKFCPECGKAA